MNGTETQSKVIAKAIRVEKDVKSGTYYLVFEVVDEAFRREIQKDWTQDLPIKLIGKDLYAAL